MSGGRRTRRRYGEMVLGVRYTGQFEKTVAGGTGLVLVYETANL
jgi:hypothetical protein